MPDQIQKLKIKILTYNQGNSNVATQGVSALRNEVFQDNPDIVCVGGQEAKQLNGRNFAERMCPEGYVVLHKNHFNVCTKPLEGVAQTDLTVLVKKEHEPFISCVAKGVEKQGNKGGLFVSLNAYGEEIDVANVHLDSFDEGKRQQQMSTLLARLPTAQQKNSQVQSNRIIMGDFNTGRFQQEEQASANPLGLDEFQGLGLDEFQFVTSDATYEKKDSQGNVRYNNKRQCLDKGPLDRIGCAGDKLKLTENVKAQVIEPTTQNHLKRNDHKPSMTSMTFEVPKLENHHQLLGLLEAKIKQKNAFDLSFGYSRYSCEIDGVSYRVPRRIYELHQACTELSQSLKEKKEVGGWGDPDLCKYLDYQVTADNFLEKFNQIVGSGCIEGQYHNQNKYFGRTGDKTARFLAEFSQTVNTVFANERHQDEPSHIMNVFTKEPQCSVRLSN